MVLAYSYVPYELLLDNEAHETTKGNLMNYFPDKEHLCMCLLDKRKMISFCGVFGAVILILGLIYTIFTRYLIDRYYMVSIKPHNASEKDFLVESIFTDPFRQHNQKEGDGG